MGKRRENNYDLLRIVSCFAVVMIHVVDMWEKDVSRYAFLPTLNRQMLAYVYDSLARFAVPCFVMISGAFILDNAKNLNYREFYHKSFQRIGIPTIIFTILYSALNIVTTLVDHDSGIRDILVKIVEGRPYYHMWYLYMLIGVYALAPWVLRLKNEIGDDCFAKVSVAFLIVGNLSMWTTEKVRLAWNIGMSFCYLGYFTVGYVIRKKIYKSTSIAVIALSLGVLVEILNGLINYEISVVHTDWGFPFTAVQPFAPLVVLSSVLIFIAFAAMDVETSFATIAGLTFDAYLIHGGVARLVFQIVPRLYGTRWTSVLDCLYWPWIVGVMVFIISLALSPLYDAVFGFIDNRLSVTDKLTHLVRL